jgi:nicotinamidase/pyrazinamidase
MRRVFIDVDGQIDFLFPAGALYAPGSEKIIPAMKQLNRFAAAHGIPVISTTDAHAENDPEFRQWAPHCVVGTTGQLKAQDTLLDKRITIPNSPVDVDTVGAQQIVVEKQTLDVFTNVNMDRVLESLGGESYVVYGVVTEYCVRCAAMGLLGKGRPVAVVTDAVETLNPANAEQFFAEFRQAGGTLTTVSQVCGQ